MLSSLVMAHHLNSLHSLPHFEFQGISPRVTLLQNFTALALSKNVQKSTQKVMILYQFVTLSDLSSLNNQFLKIRANYQFSLQLFFVFLV